MEEENKNEEVNIEKNVNDTEKDNDGRIKISLKTLVMVTVVVVMVGIASCTVYIQKNGLNKKYVKNNDITNVTRNNNRKSRGYQNFRDIIFEEKPIIYIYPEQETKVNVKLGNSENLTCTYPKYEDGGWNVIAQPNGDLKDVKTGRNLYAIYWEGQNEKVYNYENAKEGFVVKGENTTEFLEEKLEILGLNEREAEEFIVYWLPQMEKNKYNYIRFETQEEIEKEMPLEVNPKPDTVIRVLMDWKALDEEIEVKEQKLEKIERTGYTVVEWGGSELNANIVK